MATIKQQVQALKLAAGAARDNNSKNFAWRFRPLDGTLRHCTSARAQLPAALMLLAGGGKKTYTVIGSAGSWLEKVQGSDIRTKKGDRKDEVNSLLEEVAKLEKSIEPDATITQRFEAIAKEEVRTQKEASARAANERLRTRAADALRKATDLDSQYKVADSVLHVEEATLTKPDELLAFSGPQSNVVKSGKLYDAAAGRLGKKPQGLESRDAKPRSQMNPTNKNLLDDNDLDSRLLRYYMLATYALASHARCHHPIAAMLVDTHGNILSSGVNSGGWRHAETSMLFNYFFTNPDAATIPPRSIIFSTLCPCVMCTSYMQAWNTSEQPAVIFFGQFDPGDSGKAGDSNARTVQLAEVLKEPTVHAEGQNLNGAYVYKSSVHKARVEHGLQETCGRGAGHIAERLQKSDGAKRLFELARRKLTDAKAGKPKGNTEEAAQQKLAVINYLHAFLESTK